MKKVRGRGLLNLLLHRAAQGRRRVSEDRLGLYLLGRGNGLLAKPTHGDIIRFRAAAGDGGAADGVATSSRTSVGQLSRVAAGSSAASAEAVGVMRSSDGSSTVLRARSWPLTKRYHRYAGRCRWSRTRRGCSSN